MRTIPSLTELTRPRSAVVGIMLLGASHACAPAAQDAQLATQQLTAAGAPGRSGDQAEDNEDDARRSNAEPPETRAARKEWPTANHDYAGTRATRDARINASNIAGLQPAWTFTLPVVPQSYVGVATSSALVLGGKVYYQDQLSNVVVLDARTGAAVWQKQYNTPGGAPNGVAVGYGKVFAAASDKAFVALDAQTGNELWRAPIEVPQNGGIGIQPIAYGNLVYLSTVPVNTTSQYAGGVNGTLYALDQKTGKIVWSFQTVKDAGLWGNPQLNSGGGAWFPPTVDAEGETVYWGIGNPGPYPGTPEFPLGSSRPGDNLYTNSVLALEARSGRYRWHFQEAPHDLFDLDFQNPPIVVQSGGERDKRSLIIGSGKTGTVVALDARKGQLAWRSSVGRHENDKLQSFGAQGVDVYPGSLGGIIAPIAYAADTVYVPTVNWGRHFYPDHADTNLIGESGTGELVALNVADGSVRWKAQLASTPFGGASVVNDLVITSTVDGKVLAFDRQSGANVLNLQGPNGINAPISVVDDQLIIPFGIGPGAAQLVALRVK